MEKENLVLVHGWGMNSGVWRGLAAELEHYFELRYINLPDSNVLDDSAEQLQQYLEQTIVQAPEQAHWLGWSMGGMLAALIADRFNERVRSLILVSTNAVFCQQRDWQNAMNSQVFNDFAGRLSTQPVETVESFIQLQFLGVRQGKEFAKSLLEITREAPTPADQLVSGLNLLQSLDCRAAMQGLNLPTLLVNGGLDRITPVASAVAIQQLNPLFKVEILKNAGHAPFLCQQKEFTQRILQFLRTNE